jgi:hypothetical protein
LSLPTPVSTSTVCRGVRTIQVWMREPRSPVVSSKKWGFSQRWCAAIRPASDSGSIWEVGNDERPISTTREMPTSPSVRVCMPIS